MGYMIEISESKKEKLSEHIEKALHEMGKAMACVEQFGTEYGHRDSDEYGMRGNMRYRDHEDWDDDDMGERRRRSRRTGRFM
jgi:hypothetical protein